MKDKWNKFVSKANELTQRGISQAKEGLDKAMDSVNIPEDLEKKLSEATDKANQAFSDMSEKANQSIHELSDYTKKKVEDVKEKSGETLEKAKEQFKDISSNDFMESAKDKIMDTLDSTQDSFNQFYTQLMGSNASALLKRLSPEELLDFYGARFSMAFASGHASQDALCFVLDSFKFDSLKPEQQRQLFAYLITPPRFFDCLNTFRDTDIHWRHGLLLNLFEVGLVEGQFDIDQDKYLDKARKKLKIEDQAFESLEGYARKMRHLRGQKLDKAMLEQVQQSLSEVTETGVPMEALYLSLSELSNSLKESLSKKERMGRAKLVVSQLQQVIQTLIQQLDNKSGGVVDNQALTQRLKLINGVVSVYQAIAEE